MDVQYGRMVTAWYVPRYYIHPTSLMITGPALFSEQTDAHTETCSHDVVIIRFLGSKLANTSKEVNRMKDCAQHLCVS